MKLDMVLYKTHCEAVLAFGWKGLGMIGCASLLRLEGKAGKCIRTFEPT